MNTEDRNLYFERDLSPMEIDERTKLVLKLAGDRDANLAEVAGKRGEIRALNIGRKKLDLHEAQLRREIRSGKVLEPRQTELALELAPVAADRFALEYPRATDAERLHAQLAVVLQGVLVPSIVKLECLGLDVFDRVADWTRLELAYMNRRSHPDLELPPRMMMPPQLDDLRVALERGSRPTRKKAARKKAARRAGARSKRA